MQIEQKMQKFFANCGVGPQLRNSMADPRAVALERGFDEGESRRVASPQVDGSVTIEPSEMAELLDTNRQTKEVALLEPIEGGGNQNAEVDVVEMDDQADKRSQPVHEPAYRQKEKMTASLLEEVNEIYSRTDFSSSKFNLK
jgi:hypothetical protein